MSDTRAWLQAQLEGVVVAPDAFFLEIDPHVCAMRRGGPEAALAARAALCLLQLGMFYFEDDVAAKQRICRCFAFCAPLILHGDPSLLGRLSVTGGEEFNVADRQFAQKVVLPGLRARGQAVLKAHSAAVLRAVQAAVWGRLEPEWLEQDPVTRRNIDWLRQAIERV